jgi:hypothetical protein
VRPVRKQEVEVFDECVSEGADLKGVHCSIGSEAMEAEDPEFVHFGLSGESGVSAVVKDGGCLKEGEGVMSESIG